MNGNHKTAYFFLLYTFVATGGAALGMFVITRFAPATAPWFGHLGLYAAFCLVVLGLAGVGGLLLRRLLGWRVALWRSAGMIARQSALFAAVMTLALLFQAYRLLNLYTAGALVITAGLFELYVLTRSLHATEGV